MSDSFLELRNLKKSFTSDEYVLQGISLTIGKGEFITLLGASGCGKTTTLRIIAGLEQPDSGSVWLEGQDVTTLEPNRRDVNTVFQNYALFPHMNVAENIGYGLKIRKVPKGEIKKKVKEMLELVQLEGYEKRKPSELSGGQRQRVAIARALANNPRVLLLDEPLGALDLQLRRAMQLELKRLQKKLGITFIYITHDQEEAINMSDRIVVMNKGRFEQIGTPDEIYDHPRTSYVATFVGNANILKGTVASVSGSYAKVKLGEQLAKVYIGANQEEKQTEEVQIKENQTKEDQIIEPLIPGEPVTLAVRSENIVLEENKKEFIKESTAEARKDSGNKADNKADNNEFLVAIVKEKNFAAGQLRVLLTLPDGNEITASRFGMNTNIQPGQQIFWHFDPKAAVIVDKNTGENL